MSMFFRRREKPFVFMQVEALGRGRCTDRVEETTSVIFFYDHG